MILLLIHLTCHVEIFYNSIIDLYDILSNNFTLIASVFSWDNIEDISRGYDIKLRWIDLKSSIKCEKVELNLLI